MVTLLDTNHLTPRLRHPEKASREESAVLPKPDWLRVRAPGSPGYVQTRDIVREHGLHTVCEEAACPNIGECWQKRHATMMIMGGICTRACAFCNVATGLPGTARCRRAGARGRRRRASWRSSTSSSRRSIATISQTAAPAFRRNDPRYSRGFPGTTVEVLTPDFLRKDGALETVMTRGPTCSTTISKRCRGLYLSIRPGARYFHSLRLLQRAKEIDPTGLHKVRHHGRSWRDAAKKCCR